MNKCFIYKENNFRLKVRICPNSEAQIVKGNELLVIFEWDRTDPFFGFNRSWKNISLTEKPDYNWIHQSLRIHCEPPPFEIANKQARMNTCIDTIAYKIGEVVTEWVDFHRKLREGQEKLQNFFTTQ